MWTRLLKLLGLRPREVIHIATLTASFSNYDEDDKHLWDTHLSYVLLKEDGKRVCRCNGGDSLAKPKEHRLYIQVIKPWLQGADTLYPYLMDKGLEITEHILKDSGRSRQDYTRELITGSPKGKVIPFKGVN